jgi:rhodanese-related sulfurtransferase
MNALFFANRNNLFAVAVAAVAFAWLSGNGARHSLNHPPVPEVEVLQAKALIDSGALVIDVRGAEQFAVRHLPGAVPVPLAILRAGIPASVAAAKDRPIVVYCNKGTGSGPDATRLLQNAGFSKVVNLRSGIEGWTAAGLPVKSG